MSIIFNLRHSTGMFPVVSKGRTGWNVETEVECNNKMS